MLENVSVDIKSEDLKDVLNKVIDKFSDAASWVATRDTPKRIAVNSYIDDIQNSNLDSQSKAVLMFSAKRDIRRWSNTKSICEKAVEKMLNTAKVEDVDEEWANLFRENAGTISTEDMQDIWSCILAQECNEPGSMPKASLNTLLSMGKQEADDFYRLASFCLKIDGEMSPLIINTKINDYYDKHGLGLNALNKLETLGLINMDKSPIGGVGVRVEDDTVIEYFDKKVKASEFVGGNKEGISMGAVTLSYIGEALIKILVPEKVDGFFEEVALPYFRKPGKYIEDMFG